MYGNIARYMCFYKLHVIEKTMKTLNKKTIIAAVSLLAGTSLAFAHDDHAEVNMKINNGFLNKMFHSHKNDNKDKEHGRDNGKKKATDEAITFADLKTKTLKEIDTRVTTLTSLNAKVQAMTNVTAVNKAAVNTEVQSQLNALTTLRAKVVADTDLATLKADRVALTKSFKVFGFSVPTTNLAGRVEAHFSMLAGLATTSAALVTDIQTAQNAGKDVTAVRSTLTNLNAKLADANVQSNAAVAIVTPMINGSAPVNQTALMDAYAKYKIALQDIKTVKSEAKTIIKQLKDWGIAVTATLNTH